MTDFFIQTFITLFVIINPFAAVPVFVSVTQGESEANKKIVARQSCLISIFLLCLFSFIGDFLLDTLNISEGAFRITGGMLLLMSAVEMVRSKPAQALKIKTDEVLDQNAAAQRLSEICVFPLSIPFLAGPGALTSAVILMRKAQSINIEAQIGLLLILISIITFSYFCFRMSGYILKVMGLTGTNVLTRVFGIVLSALCIQSIVNGIIAVFKL